MATKDETTRTRIDSIKADLRSTSTCTSETVSALRELLSKKDEALVQKENARVKAPATARRRAATTTAPARVDATKLKSSTLEPREKYILATETANKTLQMLADALKNPPTAFASRPLSKAKPAPTEEARKPARPRLEHTKSSSMSQKPLRERSVSQMNNSPQKPAPRRSSSYSSFLSSGPDAGLVATAECARTAFAYLGTLEAMSVLGKDSQELQYENGVLVLIGKLVTLGLDNLAVKELRILKRRLDRYLGQDVGKEESETRAQKGGATDKESLASLLNFPVIDSKSPAVPLVTNLQTYTLRVIAKLKRPRLVEAAYEHLKLTNPSSPANLLWHGTKSSNGQAKAARQLECLAQTILSLCPSISRADDANTLLPSAHTVLSLQHLAFKIRKRWWSLAKHKGNEEQELWEPFAKCAVAFARRSQLTPAKNYKLAETLCTDLLAQSNDSTTAVSGTAVSAAVTKTLSSLAQAAGLSDEVLRWLGPVSTSTSSGAPAVKQTVRAIRVATVSLETYLKGNIKPDLEETIISALDALNGSLGGSVTDLESLFAEVNALRRTATRLLVADLSTLKDTSKSSLVDQRAVPMIAACIHFSARFIGTALSEEADTKKRARHRERVLVTWKCAKSIVDSAMACCKQSTTTQEKWKALDSILQECSHIIRRFEEEVGNGTLPSADSTTLVSSYMVKLSNAYWAVFLQLRRARLDPEHLVTAMKRSIDLARSPVGTESGLLPMKLEQLGEVLEDQNSACQSREAFRQCIQSHLSEGSLRQLSDMVARSSLCTVFSSDGPFDVLARVLKAYHHSFIRFGILAPDEVAFYDNDELHLGTRGALLELQLSFYIHTLSKNRQWDSTLNKSVSTLAGRLQELYVPELYPIRHVRLRIILLQLSQNHPQVLSHESSSFDVSHKKGASVAGTQDEALKDYESHLSALLSLRSSMQHTSPPMSAFQQCFATWESLVNTTSSWGALSTRIDNTETWLQELQASLEYLNAKGEEYLALPLLHLLVKTLELQKSADTSELVNTLCALGLQFLHLGYTGKSGLCLAKAEALIERQPPSTEARLRWHMVYAEYLLGLGNSAKCASTMANAQSIALADRQFMDLAKPTTTLSGRIRFNRVLADASYVHSLLSTTQGSYKEAARHARQCVTLNRRIWAALESRANAKKAPVADGTDSDAEGSNRAAFDPLSSLRNDKGMPLIMSVTHDALGGPDFWSLVPVLYRALMQQSQIFAHQGLLHEAIYVAEQAEKVASATESATLTTDNASWRADCWAQSGRPDKADTILKSLSSASSRKCLSTAGYHSAVARTHHWSCQYEEEIASYANVEQLLQELSSPSYISSLETFLPSVESLAEQISSLSLETPGAPKAKSGARGRKPAAKPAPRAASKPAASAHSKTAAPVMAKTIPKTKRLVGSPKVLEVPSVADQCAALCIFQASMRDRAVLASILHDDLAKALELLAQAEQLQSSLNQEVSHMWATFKTRLAQSAKQIAEDFTVNTLPESTIAFPAFGPKERRLSEVLTTKKVAMGFSTATKGRSKKQSKEDFMDTLRDARERLVEAHALCATNGSNHLFRQTSMALGHVTILMSAVSGSELPISLHPLYAAYMSEVPKLNALRLVRESTEAEKEQLSRDECLQWPVLHHSPFAFASVSDFQKYYVDIIPDNWTAISLALSEARDELFITRFESGLSPFVLRLPLARHASREMDEEEFSFEDGRKDFDEIIELSDFSTRSAKDMTSREARQRWWTEREALDTRLHELLINMENIWLGGFKGVFSQHERQPSLLARFRKSLENILNEHLPSRKKKSQQKRPVLDTRVLDLFIGLGDATNDNLDLDEPLMDLIYFVVDILQFNGERNAYDELDFDAMVVETHDALRAYHSASHKLDKASRHTILILDNNLHAFPWESLQCLEQLSISRLPSLAALRERLLAARPSEAHDAAPGHYIRASNGGTSMLNPSGDLAHTSKTIKPHLDELQGSWIYIANRAPSEKEFEDSLREKELVLYFGHGSGAQYVKSKAVRRLYPGQQDEDNRKPGCATTLLFGCSSVHLTENGIFEPSGMLASYLTAGAPAVVGMLWDVTDKDCDRFAVRAGELWGLWPEPQEEVAPPSKTPAKTPAKKTKGKGRVAQLADGVEGLRSSPSARKGKKTAKMTDEDESIGGERRRGYGLDEAVRDARGACVLKYLNGAAAVVYGIPVYLE